MVIFGGIGSALLGDLWMLDMETCAWRAVQATTLGGAEPPDKVMAAAAAAVGHRVWVFFRSICVLFHDAFAPAAHCTTLTQDVFV